MSANELLRHRQSLLQQNLAGDPERATRAQRQADGIALDAMTWQEIVAAGQKVGVTLPG